MFTQNDASLIYKYIVYTKVKGFELLRLQINNYAIHHEEQIYLLGTIKVVDFKFCVNTNTIKYYYY